MTRLLVTGTGRCGTGFTAHALRAAGVACGHEQVFSLPVGLGVSSPDWEGFRAECSWLAAPFLGYGAAAGIDGAVVHLVRHPLAYARSAVEIGLFDPQHRSDYTDVIYRNVPAIKKEFGVWNRALAMWVHWNSKILPYADERVRIEGLDAASLARLIAHAGGDADAAVRALSAAHSDGRATNRKEHEKICRIRTIDAGMFRPRLYEQARELAHLFGYGAL